MEVRTFAVEEGDIRLDRFLSERLPEFTRARLQKLVDAGNVRVNGRAARSGMKLSKGDMVSFIPPPAPTLLQPEAVPLRVVYEDNDIIVVDKPAGMPVHPAPGHPDHTLVNALLARLPELRDTGSDRPGIVHRLDKDTSGLIIIARNSKAEEDLKAQFKAHTVVKVYMALVKGHLAPEDGVIEAPIGRDPHHRDRMAIMEAGEGKEARTRYHVARYIGSYSLVEARPETGRTHQIRVHLAAIGYPVVGDTMYGIRSPDLSRQFLHACRLGFRLPSSGKYVEFTSELPPDLAKALGELA